MRTLFIFSCSLPAGENRLAMLNMDGAEQAVNREFPDFFKGNA
jgi:hypothetical protein